MQHLDLLTPAHWQDYQLLDSGAFQKLERFGTCILARPEPQAVWTPHRPLTQWQPDATFHPRGSHSGHWERHRPVPDRWPLSYTGPGYRLEFRLALTAFKHVGLFPEQAVNWDFAYQHCQRLAERGTPRVLNLFAYTGGASLAARRAGADVTHLDAIKQVVTWASDNMKRNRLTDIRWLVEDAATYLRREVRREKVYQGILLDPPAFGHGPKGERWKLETQINELIRHVAALLDPDGCFLVFNAYSLGFSSLILDNLLRTHLPFYDRMQGQTGELFLPEQGTGRRLPCGVVSRLHC